MGDRTAVGLLAIAWLGCGSGGDHVPDARRLVDAPGTIDAPAIADASEIDARTIPDGNFIDAAVIDATVIDATVPDASPLDAPALPDASVPLPDASPPDALVCAPALNPTADGSTGAPQDLVISEINPGNYIELWNNTFSTINLGSSPYWLCSPFSYCDLASLGAGYSVAGRSYVALPWPSATSGCFATFVDGDAGGEILLYDSGIFSDSSSIADFVCWGTNPHGTRKSQAESVGKWSGACAGALTMGAIHRLIGTDGVNAGDYSTVAPPTPMTCTP